MLELDSSGAIAAVNVYAPDGLVGRWQGGNWTQYTFDANGNVAQRLNGAQSVVASSVFDGYGVESSSGLTDSFGYQARWGYLRDLETGLYVCERRYYDPTAGPWLTRDPISFDGGINLYAYCEDGPTLCSDPSGLSPESIAGDLPSAQDTVAAEFEETAIDRLFSKDKVAAQLKIKLIYGKYCGPQTVPGSGKGIDELDECCHAHDDCFARCGCTLFNQKKKASCKLCTQTLCDCMKSAKCKTWACRLERRNFILLYCHWPFI